MNWNRNYLEDLLFEFLPSYLTRRTRSIMEIEGGMDTAHTITQVLGQSTSFYFIFILIGVNCLRYKMMTNLAIVLSWAVVFPYEHLTSTLKGEGPLCSSFKNWY
jgi:hypothetical protein